MSIGTAMSVGIGAGLMYLLDPISGRRRRAFLRDKITRLIIGRRRGGAFGAAMRAGGAAAVARALKDQPPRRPVKVEARREAIDLESTIHTQAPVERDATLHNTAGSTLNDTAGSTLNVPRSIFDDAEDSHGSELM